MLLNFMSAAGTNDPRGIRGDQRVTDQPWKQDVPQIFGNVADAIEA